MRYAIRDCRLADLPALARTLRLEDRAEIEAAGFQPKHLLFALWRASSWRRTALVDSEIAACWGDAAGALSLEGAVWLFTAPPIERLPLAFFREARREVAERLRVRSSLRSEVAAGYPQALRFFQLLGFAIGEPHRIGPYGEVYRDIVIER